ncbi:MAG: hypothetical protein KGY57_06285 [Gammaproteobacteria bacterium]|nr:hypothetical protein [Gammaproteobacteria bacterium]
MTIEMTDLGLLKRVLDRTQSGTLTAAIDGLTVTVEWPDPEAPKQAPTAAAPTAPTPPKTTEQADQVYLRAPMVGMLADSAHKVIKGDSVTAGDTLLEIQTGDRVVPVKASVTGTVIDIRSYAERELIHCGHWLIAIKPA